MPTMGSEVRTRPPSADQGGEMDAPNGRPARGRKRGRRRPSKWAVLVFVVLAVPTLTGAGLARRGVQREEHRILEERSAEVVALLSTSIDTANAALSIVGSLAAAQDLAGFARSAGLVAQTGLGGVVAAVTEQDGGLVVLAGVGGPQTGQRITGERAEAIRRALAARQLVGTVLVERDGSRTFVAVPLPGPVPIVTYQEGLLTERRRVPATPDSPFRELRGTVYASADPDPGEDRPHHRGR